MRVFLIACLRSYGENECKKTESICLPTHFAFGDGSAHCLHYKVGPEGVKELKQDQKQVKDPPGRVGSHNVPALEQGGVQNPSE